MYLVLYSCPLSHCCCLPVTDFVGCRLISGYTPHSCSHASLSASLLALTCICILRRSLPFAVAACMWPGSPSFTSTPPRTRPRPRPRPRTRSFAPITAQPADRKNNITALPPLPSNDGQPALSLQLTYKLPALARLRPCRPRDTQHQTRRGRSKTDILAPAVSKPLASAFQPGLASRAHDNFVSSPCPSRRAFFVDPLVPAESSS